MISVIVPLAPDEEFNDACREELSGLPDEFEVILVSQDGPEHVAGRIRNVRAKAPGRAAALNTGTAAASDKCDRFWFLHADTRLPDGAVPSLLEGAKSHPDALLYFRISYYDGTKRHKINSSGATLRSRLFGAPFGDQGFCVSRSLHERIGGFREDAPYGEDHLYARAASRAGARLVMLPAVLGTSARKHKEVGWLALTMRYQWMWVRQALGDRRAVGRGG